MDRLNRLRCSINKVFIVFVVVIVGTFIIGSRIPVRVGPQFSNYLKHDCLGFPMVDEEHYEVNRRFGFPFRTASTEETTIPSSEFFEENDGTYTDEERTLRDYAIACNDKLIFWPLGMALNIALYSWVTLRVLQLIENRKTEKK